MWMSKHDRHLTDERLVACYFAEDSDVAAAADRSHTAICDACAQRYADVTRDLELLADHASAEADVALTPEMLAHQRTQVMRRLEGHGRRADIFVFPTRRNAALASRTSLKRPARWVAAAAAAGLTVGLGLGFSVERFRVSRFQVLSGPITSRGERRAPAPPGPQADPRFQQTQAEPIPNQAVNQVVASDDELLEEIDTALVSRRIEELRALDALTPENASISVRRR